MHGGAASPAAGRPRRAAGKSPEGFASGEKSNSKPPQLCKLNEMREAFVFLQTAIEAIERAITHAHVIRDEPIETFTLPGPPKSAGGSTRGRPSIAPA